MIKIERVNTFKLYSMIKLIVPLLSSYYLLHISQLQVLYCVVNGKKSTSVRSCFKYMQLVN